MPASASPSCTFATTDFTFSSSETTFLSVARREVGAERRIARQVLSTVRL
jgi:hypothetical protein